MSTQKYYMYWIKFMCNFHPKVSNSMSKMDFVYNKVNETKNKIKKHKRYLFT